MSPHEEAELTAPQHWCGARVVPVAWGYPVGDDELMAAAERGEVHLGGCIVPRVALPWWCPSCGVLVGSDGRETFWSDPVAVEVRGTPTWGADVHLGEGRLAWFEGDHEHVCSVTGEPTWAEGVLVVPTDEHGPVRVRPITENDQWPVFPANISAWQAAQTGLR